MSLNNVDELRAAQMQWQPISTAPKDGTRVLLSDGVYIHIGYFTHEATVWNGEDDDHPHWVVWDCDDHFYSFHLIGDYEPTHWRQLPEPPVVTMSTTEEIK